MQAAGRGRLDVQGVRDVGERHVVQELFGIDRPREQAVHVVLPIGADVALGAQHDAVVGVAQIVVATAAFDVAAQQREGRRARGGNARARAELGDFLRRQQRAVAGDGERLAEDAAGRRLRNAVVIHEHDLGVGVEGGVHLIVRIGAGRIPIVRPLVVVDRAEIVGVGGRVVRPHGVARAALVDDERIGGRAGVGEVEADDVGRAGGARAVTAEG